MADPKGRTISEFMDFLKSKMDEEDEMMGISVPKPVVTDMEIEMVPLSEADKQHMAEVEAPNWSENQNRKRCGATFGALRSYLIVADNVHRWSGLPA